MGMGLALLASLNPLWAGMVINFQYKPPLPKGGIKGGIVAFISEFGGNLSVALLRDFSASLTLFVSVEMTA